jgi:hypothetical protein
VQEGFKKEDLLQAAALTSTQKPTTDAAAALAPRSDPMTRRMFRGFV